MMKLDVVSDIKSMIVSIDGNCCGSGWRRWRSCCVIRVSQADQSLLLVVAGVWRVIGCRRWRYTSLWLALRWLIDAVTVVRRGIVLAVSVVQCCTINGSHVPAAISDQRSSIRRKVWVVVVVSAVMTIAAVRQQLIRRPVHREWHHKTVWSLRLDQKKGEESRRAGGEDATPQLKFGKFSTSSWLSAPQNWISRASLVGK